MLAAQAHQPRPDGRKIAADRVRYLERGDRAQPAGIGDARMSRDALEPGLLPSAEPGGSAMTIRRSLEEAFETAMLHQIHRDVELARLRHPAVDIQLVTPSAPLRLRPLEFDSDGIARALALGRADRRRRLVLSRRERIS